MDEDLDDIVEDIKPTNIIELLISIRDDKYQDSMKIDNAWYKLTEKAPIPMPEEMRENLFNVLYHNYQNGLYKVGNESETGKKKKRKRK